MIAQDLHVPGSYKRMEHQLRRGNKRLFFRTLLLTSCVKIGIISSSVLLSMWWTWFRRLSVSDIISVVGMSAMADDIMLGIYR
jgi:hypothetical protein